MERISDWMGMEGPIEYFKSKPINEWINNENRLHTHCCGLIHRVHYQRRARPRHTPSTTVEQDSIQLNILMLFTETLVSMILDDVNQISYQLDQLLNIMIDFHSRNSKEKLLWMHAQVYIFKLDEHMSDVWIQLWCISWNWPERKSTYASDDRSK